MIIANAIKIKEQETQKRLTEPLIENRIEEQKQEEEDEEEKASVQGKCLIFYENNFGFNS